MGFNPVDLAFGHMNALQSSNERLKAENAKLRDQLEEQKCFAADLMRDIRELRELVLDMWFWHYEGHIDNVPQEEQTEHIDGVMRRMRELGVEL